MHVWCVCICVVVVGPWQFHLHACVVCVYMCSGGGALAVPYACMVYVCAIVLHA